jgi:hypothetical protein
MHGARRREQLKRNIHTASQPLTAGNSITTCCIIACTAQRVATSPNCSLVAAAAAWAHCTCGCACTGITCSCVASAPVSTCFLTSGARISASSSELRHTSLPMPLPQPPLPAPRPQAPPRPQLALRLRFTPTTPLCSSLCAPEILLRGHKPLVAAYAAQRQTLPSRRLHGLVAAKLLRALRCQVLDSA